MRSLDNIIKAELRPKYRIYMKTWGYTKQFQALPMDEIEESPEILEMLSTETSSSNVKNYIFVGLLTLISQLIVSGYSVISVLYIKNEKINIYLFIWLRSLLSTPMTLILSALIENGLTIPKPPYKWQLCYFTIMGFVVNNLEPLFYLYAINLTSGSYCAIFPQLVPIFTTVFIYLFRIEPIKSLSEPWAKVQIFGVLVGCAFAGSIVWLQFHGFDPSQTITSLVIGTVILVMNSGISSLQYIIQTKLFYRNPCSNLKDKPLATQAYSVSFGCIIYCAVIVPYFWYHPNIFYEIPHSVIIPLLYSSIILCPVSYGLMAYCSKILSPMIVGAGCSLNVAITLVMLRIFAGEQLQTSQYVLSVGVIVGILIVLFSPIFRPLPKME